MLGSITGWLGMPGSETLPPSKSQLALADVLADRQEGNGPAANEAAIDDDSEAMEQKLYGAPARADAVAFSLCVASVV